MKRSIGGLTVCAVALLAGAQQADAATFLGSPDATAAPDGYACATGCAPGAGIGFRQFALRDAMVDAPEDGVLVSASVSAKRIAGSAPAQLAVLRPADDAGVGVTVVESVPVPSQRSRRRGRRARRPPSAGAERRLGRRALHRG